MLEWEARLARSREQFTGDIQTRSQSCGPQSWLSIRITWGVKTLLSGGCTPDQLNPSLWRWEPDISSFQSSPRGSNAAKVESRRHYMGNGLCDQTKGQPQ